ncbi:calycin-like domain-containing protein [Leyella stercorea]|uniref:calycin-like domain-containing protein n=1 Tax=Leyella stercorea TaxID=363265 RepID=UPI002432EA42|nr:calycin-like domain-containing protein [Leyella stercorea]
MKKILSLLSMLMITVMAFATDYKGQLDYTVTTRTGDLTGPSNAQGVLKIEPYAGGKYTVTATGCDLSSIELGNWDEIICEGVEGTTDANGVTTIDVAPYAFRGSDNAELKNAKLFVKFKGDKAYATFEGTYNPNFYTNYKLKYTFGVDEGFDGGGSTGGGETGGEDKPAAFEKVDFVGDGTNFNWSIPVNWDTQKIVMSIDPSTCTGACEDIIGLGEVATAWDNTLHLYRKTDKTLQGYFQIPGGSNNNTNPFDETNPIKVEVSKAQGFVVNGVVKIPASQMSALFALSTVNMGTGEGANDKSRATYKYVKVVDKDWTEVPPVTVKDTKKFENVAYTTSMGGNGTATVTFTEMSDGTFPMTFVSDDLNVKAENLTKSEDAKGRTTYTGTAKRTDVDVTFTVKAVVYTEGTEEKLYMTMDNGSSFVVTVGEDPDYVAPVVYKNTLKVVRGTDTKAYENAEVSVLAKGENKYAVTIPSFTDMDQMEGTIGKLTFEATGVEENGTLKLTATSAATTQEGGSGWDNAGFTASMDATVTGETLAGTFTVVYPNDATNYTYTLYYGVEPPVAPDEPKDETVVEKYQADGTGFSKTINVDWDKQKIVASIDFSNGGDDKDILAMTTGESFTAFQTSTYRTMHWYCNQTDKQVSGFFAKSGAGNNNTGRMDVADCLAKFEISKAEGLKVNGVVKMTPTVLEELLTGTPIIIGSGESPKFSNAFYNYIKVVSLDWKEPTEPEVKEEKTFNEALYMVQGTTSTKVADAKVVVKEMSDNTINMSLQFNGNEYTSTELTKGTDEKNRTTYTGKVSKDTQTFDVVGVVYEKETADRLYMTMTATGVKFVVGENPDAVTPEVTEVSNKTYTSNLRILDGETTVVEEAEADVNIIKYSDESYKVTLKNVNMLNKTQDLVFVGKALIEEAPTEATEPLKIIAKSDAATTEFFGEEMSATFEITEVSAEEIKMGFVLNNTSLEYQGEFNYTEEETPEVYTNNLHIYDAAAPETDLFQADQAKVEFLATATGGFKLTLKDVTLNEKKSDLVFTGTLPTPQPGGQDPLAEEGETTPAEPAMVLNATADEATATFLGATSATAVFNVSYDKNDNFMMTFTITAGDKNYAGEFNYEKKNPETPDPEKYPINFDKTANSTHNSRALNSFSLQQTGKEKQTKSVKTSKAAYEDHTADEPFTVEAGSELTASFDYTGEWMHSFVYIDFDNDGQFSYKEGQWDQTGTDLVAFSFYSLDSNPKNDASGYNSVGDELTGDARNTYVAPSFKAPAKAGEYRIRFKFDWNCILPGGSSTILEDGGGVWDATLKVVEPVVDGISTINAETANGEAQLFTIDGVKLNKLQKGLNIVRTADGKVKKVLVK